MRRLVSSVFAEIRAVWASRRVGFSAFGFLRLRNVVAMSALALLLWWVPTGAQADSPLRRPLTFLPAGAILVVDPTPANAGQDRAKPA